MPQTRSQRKEAEEEPEPWFVRSDAHDKVFDDWLSAFELDFTRWREPAAVIFVLWCIIGLGYWAYFASDNIAETTEWDDGYREEPEVPESIDNYYDYPILKLLGLRFGLPGELNFFGRGWASPPESEL
mmetsp:Transcript_24989/g.75001  ORF Transcript_24989/g.75001 Transcript_24989/m.75001 type:complete len:128 (+) Transcript_24989:150-533(+)